MQTGLYQGFSAIEGLEKWQQAISQNLAASSVPGYKQTAVTFRAEPLGEKIKETGTVSSESETEESVSPIAVDKVSFKKGAIAATGVSTDIAINGKGFFEVTDEAGKKFYTRNGQFHFDSENFLVNSKGQKVSGASGDITRISGGGSITIERDGRIMQGGQEVNRIAVFDIKNPDSLIPVGGAFKTGANNETALAAQENIDVLQGYIESSNVDPVHQMVQLIQVSQAYATNSKIISELDDQYGQAIRYLGSA